MPFLLEWPHWCLGQMRKWANAAVTFSTKGINIAYTTSVAPALANQRALLRAELSTFSAAKRLSAWSSGFRLTHHVISRLKGPKKDFLGLFCGFYVR